MEIGFYWVRPTESGDMTVAHYNGDSCYPWSIIGCDEFLEKSKVVALEKIPNFVLTSITTQGKIHQHFSCACS